VYRVDDLPVFQNRMFASAEVARNCVKGDVFLVQDLGTGLVFNRDFRPELMQYDSNYQNEQAVSGVFRGHLKNVLSIVESHFKGQSLIEVGCGKGHFLELLQSAGFKITGLDPAYEGSNTAIIKEYFQPETGLHADGIILRHVLEHVQNPIEFLKKIRDSNGGTGKIYIEVPCLDWISDRRAWFDIFYEHVNYFRLSDFYRMFGNVFEAGHVFAGQYLYVVADLASIRIPRFENGVPFSLPKDFLSTIDRHAQRLRQQGSTRSAIWGGASKGVTFALYMHRAGASIDLVFDINPAKHGKYLPSTGFMVHSPEKVSQLLPQGADIFVMNGNYLEEIVSYTNNRFNYVTVDHEYI
jgi:SAM-dependent methyltransferase